jgi:hypothetical protein
VADKNRRDFENVEVEIIVRTPSGGLFKTASFAREPKSRLAYAEAIGEAASTAINNLNWVKFENKGE